MSGPVTETPVRRPLRGPTALTLVALLVFTNVPAALAASAPALGAIVAPVDPLQVGAVVAVTAAFEDADSTEHGATWTWGDGTTSPGTIAFAAGSGTVTGSHAYLQPGVYRVGLAVTDETGATGSASFEFVVVYDPSGGFVTGGGWINSPLGAFPADPSLTGRANFGLVAKHQIGKTTPQGTTEFQFHAAGFSFHSVAYEWLVVSGARAQFRGTGTIRGRDGTFLFFVTAIDGDLLGGDHPDQFRLKVFDDNGVIYDNELGASDDADPVTALGGGSIVIHKSKAPAPVNHAPVANAGPDQAVTAGTLVTVNGSGSSDPDGDTLTYAWTLVSRPAGSAATLTGATTIAPQFTADLGGIYVVRLVVNDGNASSTPDQVTISANTPPTVNAGPDRAGEVGATIALAATFTDPDTGDAHTASIDWGDGTVTAGVVDETAKTIVGSHAYTVPGTYVVVVTVTDSFGASGADSFTLTIAAAAHAPTAIDDVYAATEDGVLTVPAPGILGNDTDVDGDTLTAILASGPAHGSLILNANGSFTYTPSPNYNGTDSFTYRASDGTAQSAVATVRIEIEAVNDAPVAVNDAVSTTEDGAVTFSVLANDSDVDGALELTSFAVVIQPSHGTIQMVDPATILLRYTPSSDFHGTDTFTYSICDLLGACDTAVVIVTVLAVNDGPVALADSYSVNEDTALTVTAPGVLANDSDADGGTLTAVLIAGPAHGSLTFNADGSFLYTPQLDFAGVDEFGYLATDGAATSSSTIVTVSVIAVNDAPIADAGTDGSGTIGVAVQLDGSSSLDPDGDTLTYSWAIISGPAGNTIGDPTSVTPMLTPVVGGGFVIQLTVSDGSLSDTDTMSLFVNTPPTVNAGPDRELVAGGALDLVASFTDPDADTHTATIDWGDGTITPALVDEVAKTIVGSHVYALQGTFTVIVTVTDTFATSGSDTLTATVSAANTAPTAVDDAYGVDEDAVLVVVAPGLLGDDTDVDDDTLTAVLVTEPLHGDLSLAADGSLTYTPAPNFTGTDDFTYRASDGAALSAPATVIINVAPVNDPPVALDDTATTTEDTPVLIDALSNDTDVDGPLVASSVSVTLGAAHGTTAVGPDTGRITYTPQADFHGLDGFTYQVCDAAPACDTAVVAITVMPVNDPPLADAGDDATAGLGQLVTLDGSGSSDGDGDTLTYSWTIVSAPAGSTATLTGPTSVAPTFTPDRNGVFAIELVVNDGSATDADQVDITVLGLITLTPDPLNLHTNTTDSLVVTLSSPAGAGGQSVDLSANGSLVTIPVSVLVPAGEVGAAFDVASGTTSGSVVVSASATGFVPGSATVNVAAGTLLLTLEDELVGVGRSTDGTITLFTPAPAGGTVVTLVITDTSIATVTPVTVTIPAGETQGAFLVTGVAVGVTMLTGTAPGYLPAEASVAVTDALISIGNIPELGPDETEGVPISLTKPAPPGGLTITLVTTDEGIATVTPTVTVAAGQFLPPANPQVTGHSLGTTEIIASAPGFASGHRSVVVALKLTFSPTSLSVGVATTRDITLLLSHPAPTGGLTVQLHTDHPSRATVPATVTFPQGLTSVIVPVTGVGSGTTTLRANAAGIAEATATIIVGAPINISNQTLGKDLQVSAAGTLGVVAPAGNQPVTFTSSDPSRVILSSSATAAGGPSATVIVPAGTSGIPPVYIQALQSSGTVQVTATALGYTDGVFTVTLSPSGFWIWAPGFAQSFTTNSFAANSTVIVSSVQLPPNLVGGFERELRGGLTVNVDVSSSVTTVGTITTSPIVFQGGTGARKTTLFDPQGPGVSILSIPSPVPGFSVPATLGQTVTATVEAPDVLFHNVSNLTVGRDLQSALNVMLESAPPGPVDVTVSVAPGDEGVVSLTKTATAEGTSSVTFTNVTNTALLTLWVQGRALEDTQLIASAVGYNGATLPVTVTPSGFWIWAPGFAQSFTTNSFAANSTVIVSSVRLPSNLVGGQEMEIRGGLTVNVDVTSSVPAVGTITTSPIVFQGGTGARKTTLFDPLGAGVSILSIPSPVPGFSVPATLGQTVTATVIAPNVIFHGLVDLSVGRDLQNAVNVHLESAPPGPVDVTVSITGTGTGAVTLSKVRTAEGANSVTFTGVTNTNLLTLWVQGRTFGDVELTASATGYSPDTLPVTVTPSGFWMFAPGFASSFTTNTFAAPSSVFVRAARLTPTLAPSTEQEVRGGISVSVDVTSSNTTVGSIVVSPLTFAGGGASTLTALFDPHVVGVTTLSKSTPAGFSTPSTSHTVVATVRAPEVRIANLNVSSQRIGRDLQLGVQVNLEDAPPEPVDVTITVAAGGEGIVSVSKVRTAEGTNTVTFAGVTTVTVGTLWIQGRALGSTQLSGVAAGYNDATSAIAIDPSGFRMYGPGFANAITTTSGAANTAVIVTADRLDPTTLNVAVDQEVRGGLTVNIPVTSSNTAVGIVTTSPIVFQGGTGATKQSAFDPIAVGTAIVSMPVPVPGFSIPSNASLPITFTVNP
jgi:VCBS repeat-containing protein